jgi:poly(hydroxyalkanoate) granule-associated protein
MVTKLQKNKPSKTSDESLKGTVKDSAQQIWQAGLGAFTKAQAEGAKAIETLVKDSVSIQRKTKAAAEERISEATSRMTSMATDISSKASGQWDKLENIFEDRVAKALNKLGVPSAKDINVLIARIDDLNKAVKKLSANTPVAKPIPVKATTPKTVVKPAAKQLKPVSKKSA